MPSNLAHFARMINNHAGFPKGNPPMKTLDEAKGIAIYREVAHEDETFLVIIMKFGNCTNYLVLDIAGNVVDNNPFRQVFDELLKKLC